MALCVRKDGVLAASVRREAAGGKPVVVQALSFRIDGFDAGALAKVAKELQAPLYRFTTLLGGGDYQLLSVEAPTVEPDELKSAIRWRLKDMLDYRVEDATVDVLDVPVDKNAPSRSHSMFAVAARNQLIEQRQKLFEEAKIDLAVIDIPEMAQRNIAALLEPEGRGLALLSFDADGGLLTISFAGELYLSRRIDIPFSQLAPAGEGLADAAYDRITLELQRSLDHFDRQYHFITMSKLVIAPLGEGAEGLRSYLAANLYLPVDTLRLEDVLEISAIPALQSLEEQQRYFLAIGAALRHEEKAL